MKQSVIIVAGGKGERMGCDMPKQFLLAAGKPIIIHTIEAFLSYNPDIEIVLVLPKAHTDHWHEMIERYPHCSFCKLVCGGANRFESVRNGLQLVDQAYYIGVHDGVRPLVSPQLIDRCYGQARLLGSAVPVVGMTDSLREVEGADSKIIDRSRIVQVQTPQVFRAEWLRHAYNMAYDPIFTDDASVVEMAGYKISLVEGEAMNIKITTPFDRTLLEVYLQDKSPLESSVDVLSEE